MQDIGVCLSCQSEFDSQMSIPVMLPCAHTVCQTCLFVEFKKQKQNKCPYCSSVSNNNPNCLARNEALLKQLEDKEAQKSRIEEQINTLKEQKGFLKQVVQQIKDQQSYIMNEVIRFITEALFSSSNQSQSKLTEILQSINQRIRVFEQTLENSTIRNKFNLKQMEGVLSQLQINDALNLGYSEIEKLQGLQKKLFALIEQNFELGSKF